MRSWFSWVMLFVLVWSTFTVFLPGIQAISTHSRVVVLHQIPEATDTDVVRMGMKIVDLIGKGYTVIYNGQPISLEEAEEMVDF